jgi:protein-disulfide isomerase
MAGAWSELGLLASVPDMDAFETCVARLGFASKVERDRDAGRRLGIRGVPAVMVNEHLFSRPLSTEELTSEIERILDRE